MTYGKFLTSLLGAVRWTEQNSTKPGSGSLLERAIADLEALNRSSEQDFLSVGEKLTEFLEQARRISSGMVDLREMISGESGRHASQVLASVLERSRQFEARAEADDRALARVRDEARHIGRTFGGFQDTVALFRVLASLTRIETARLGNTGAEFGGLAEEVNALTQGIESSGRGILDASTLLGQRMQATIGHVAGLRAGEFRQLPSLIAEVTAGLDSLEERNQRAREESLRQGAGYTEISAAFEDLIGAIQFHDITHQQIEHVVEALQLVQSALGPGRDRSALNVTAVLTLQASQLSHTEAVFGSATDRLERNLDLIADRVHGMAEASQTLLGMTAGEKDSFFLQLEGRCAAILKVFGACIQAEDQTTVALGELTDTVARMRESVAEVREIEIRIHRIAVNATIRAIQIGDSGNALQVVADVMHRLALDSSRTTGEVATALDAIAAAAISLSGDTGAAADGARGEGEGTLSEVRSTIRELHSSSENSLRRLGEITALSQRLGDGVRSVRNGFSAGKVLAEVLDSTRAALRQVVAEAGSAPGTETGAGDPRLDELAARYTMQAEREVHQSVAGGVLPERPASVAVPASISDEEDLGDNVELF